MIYGSYQRTKGLRTSVDANGKNNINKRLYYLQMFLFVVTTLARHNIFFFNLNIYICDTTVRWHYYLQEPGQYWCPLSGLWAPRWLCLVGWSLWSASKQHLVSNLAEWGQHMEHSHTVTQSTLHSRNTLWLIIHDLCTINKWWSICSLLQDFIPKNMWML